MGLRTPLPLLLLASPAWPANPPAPRLPLHEEPARVARFTVHAVTWGTLGTISSVPAMRGQPFANVFSLSDGLEGESSGVPYYLSPLQMSVGDLQVNPNATLTVTLAQTDYCKTQGFDPQSPLCAHVMLSGSVTKVNDTEEMTFAKKSLFSRHPEMESWPSDHNWFFAKLAISNIWVIHYFGGAKIVTPEEYYKAKP